MKNTVILFAFLLFCVTFSSQNNELKLDKNNKLSVQPKRVLPKTNTLILLNNVPIVIIKRD